MSNVLKSENNLVAKCDCNHHAVEVEFDPEFNLYYLGFWRHWTSPFPLPWLDRLRWIYYLIVDGTLQPDNIVLQKEQAQEIAEFIFDKNLSQPPKHCKAPEFPSNTVS